MSKRDAFYKSLVFENDNLSLPEDEAERKRTARSLFGATLVACADVKVDTAKALLADPVEFAGFTADQKEKVLALISECVYGVLYWHCVKMDQFHGADLRISVVEHDGNGEDLRSTVIASLEEPELHHSYFDWAEHFVDHYDLDYDARLAYNRSLAESPAY